MEMTEQEIHERMAKGKNLRPLKKAEKMMSGAWIQQRHRGKNKGKYVLYNLSGKQQRLLRFVGVPLYVIRIPQRDGKFTDYVSGKVYTDKEAAEEMFKFLRIMDPVMITLTLREDQIVK